MSSLYLIFSANYPSISIVQNDSESDHCLLCRSIFSIRVRRHHCRVCYRLVCGSCSPHIVELVAGEGPVHRACNECIARSGRILSTTASGGGGISSSNGQYTGATGGGGSGVPGHSDINDQVLVKVFIHCAENLRASSDTGFLSATDSTRNAFCTFTLANKQLSVGNTSPVQSLNPVWNELIQFRWHDNSHELHYLYVDLWDKGRRSVVGGGDELIGKCRIPLSRLA